MIIYRYEQYVIKKVISREGVGYIAYNRKANFENNHTHCKSLKVAKALVKLASKRKMPKSKDKRIVESLIRLSNNEKYRRELEKIGEKE